MLDNSTTDGKHPRIKGATKRSKNKKRSKEDVDDVISFGSESLLSPSDATSQLSSISNTSSFGKKMRVSGQG